jgi:hypothetical protein
MRNMKVLNSTFPVASKPIGFAGREEDNKCSMHDAAKDVLLLSPNVDAGKTLLSSKANNALKALLLAGGLGLNIHGWNSLASHSVAPQGSMIVISKDDAKSAAKEIGAGGTLFGSGIFALPWRRRKNTSKPPSEG